MKPEGTIIGAKNTADVHMQPNVGIPTKQGQCAYRIGWLVIPSFSSAWDGG